MKISKEQKAANKIRVNNTLDAYKNIHKFEKQMKKLMDVLKYAEIYMNKGLANVEKDVWD